MERTIKTTASRATLMMSFATTWLSDAIVFYLHPLGASQELGIFFIVFAACALLMLASALPKRTLATVMVVAVPRFLVDGGRWDYRQSPGRKIPAARKSSPSAASVLYPGNLAAQRRNIERQPGGPLSAVDAANHQIHMMSGHQAGRNDQLGG